MGGIQSCRFPYVGRPWEPFPAVSYPSLFPSFGQINEAITGLVVFFSLLMRPHRCHLSFDGNTRECMQAEILYGEIGFGNRVVARHNVAATDVYAPSAARALVHEDGGRVHDASLVHFTLCDTGLNSS